jgi:putative transposase
MLRRRGVVVNHKKVHRLYREEGLMVRRKTRRKISSQLHTLPPTPVRPNERWSMDVGRTCSPIADASAP